jgi:hypothetical protein
METPVCFHYNTIECLASPQASQDMTWLINAWRQQRREDDIIRCHAFFFRTTTLYNSIS